MVTKNSQQPEVNTGLVGHVDRGKTTLVQALSDSWTDQRSEEMKCDISIRFGYADATFCQTPGVDASECYTVEEETEDGEEMGVSRTVSFIDASGHETLMATILSGVAIMDGAILLVSATEDVSQAQTTEHLMAFDIIGIENIVIVRNKADLVDRERAVDNYEQIQKFVEGTVAEDASIVPTNAQQEVNLDLPIEAIEEEVPAPDRDGTEDSQIYVARSFDTNRLGTTWDGLAGGVIGGSVVTGKLEAGNELELRPGREVDEEGRTEWRSITIEIRSPQAGGNMVDEVRPGGLCGVGIGLDPSFTKSDVLAGQAAGGPGTLPPTCEQFTMDVELLDRVVGDGEGEGIDEISTGEPLMLTVGITITVGTVTSARSGEAEISLKYPVCAEEGAEIAINRRVGVRWRLIGIGTLK